MNKTICIVTGNYPSEDDPTIYAFVDQLACAMADFITVIVISPIDFTKLPRLNHYQAVSERITNNKKVIKIYRPKYLSLGRRKVLSFELMNFTYISFKRAVKSVLCQLGKVDYLYGHFLAPSGICVAELGKEFGIPSFCAFGESSLWSINFLEEKKASEKLSMLSGIVSVSSDNKRVLTKNNLYRSERIGVFPNGCDSELFYPRDKAVSRKQLGFPKDETIGIFVGSFNDRKGASRVDAASTRIPGLKMVYAGSGEDKPKGDNILFCGSVSHSDLPVYLSAADFFVLPTRAEGCCNAIVEALFCGLPIISSNGSFNDDILNDSNSVRIDPDNIDEIKNAIENLISNKSRQKIMRESALSTAKRLDIKRRALDILSFMEKYSEE